MKILEITIDPKGQTKVETKGFTGSSCRAASQFLVQALGKTTGEVLTAEFYQREPARQTLQEGQ